MFCLLWRSIMSRIIFPLGRTTRNLLSKTMCHLTLPMRWLPSDSKSFGPPRGYYHHARTYVDQHDGRYQTVFPERKRVHAEPSSIYSSTHWKFKNEKESTLREDYVATIPKGRIVGTPGDVVTANDRLLADASKQLATEAQCHHLLRKPWLPTLEKIDGNIAVLASDRGSEFYHWFVDVLPRIYLVNKSKERIDYYYVPDDDSYKKKTLQKIGIDSGKIINPSQDHHIEAAKVIVPSLPRTFGNVPRWSTEFLRKRLIPTVDEANSKLPSRVYIDRVNVLRRKVANRERTINFLKKYNFKPVRLENYKWDKQVSIVRNASIIVAPHGAGLVNTIFCSDGCNIIEIFSPNYMNLCYWKLLQNLNVRYHYIIGSGKRPKKGNDPHYGWDPIEVNIDALENTLEAILR